MTGNWLRGFALVLVSIILFAAPALWAATIYVKIDSPNDGPGNDWDHACHTVTAGLNAAAYSDEVWAAKGIYIERITLKSGVALYGGFAGTETLRDQRDWKTNATVLDGNQRGSVVTSPSGATSATRIDGFTIRNGEASRGGGIYCSSSSPTIVNNTITGNTAKNGNGYSYGGGIYCSSSSPTITNNTITGNTAKDGTGYTCGGGVYCSYSSPTITNNAIIGNTSGGSTFGEGGGIYCSYSSPAITNNSITGNTATGSTAGWGAGIRCSYSSPTITNNTISENGVGSAWASGIYCTGSSPTIANNAIAGNGGPGVYCINSSSPTITNNLITSNSGAGVNCSNAPSPTIVNNTIIGNGDGISCSASSPRITGNTIAANRAGLYVTSSSSPAISNNAVAFNHSGICNSGGTPTLRNNDVYGNVKYDYSGLSAGAGDISADPLFASNEYGNVHIRRGSPCINAGWNEVPGLPTNDMDGQARVQGGTVDIGADESDGSDPPAGPYILVRVSPNGDDANDGSSWSLAKRTIQASALAASTLGGEVWVKAGTYNERIILPAYAYLYGGFAGTETAREERNWTVNKSIIDGGAAGSVVTIQAGERCSRIDGFTIRNGNAVQGSGICCLVSSPTIAHNLIVGNCADGLPSYGGGIYCGQSSPTIVNNTIVANKIRFYGAGICCEGTSSPIISNNTIRGNSGVSGGGISCGRYSSPIIANNAIIGNGAYYYGGGIYGDTCSATITNNTIAYNSAMEGGAILCQRGCSFVLSNNILALNSSGVYNENSTFSMRSNDIWGNTDYDFHAQSAGADDISSDPLFVSGGYGNVHIRPGSPCIDAGWREAPGQSETDIDAQPRIQGGCVDIGADESDGTEQPPGPYTVIRVSPEGSDSNDGATWASAKRTIRAAVSAASALGGEVWVKAGTYNERITLWPYAYLCGGFAGTEATREQRNWLACVTIIDGEAANCVVTAMAGNKCGAVDGFTIRNGKTKYYGGGVCCYGAPMIANCTIRGNSASQGGGVYCSSPANVTNNIIRDNTVVGGGGGGVCCGSSSPTIANNLIVGNVSTSYSGRGGDGGGISCASGSATVVSNTIAGNGASMRGGGVVLWGTSDTIVNNIVAFNASGIWSDTDGPVLNNNNVYANTAYDYSGLSAGAGDIALDPLFVNRFGGDYHLSAGSPCIDKGWNGAAGIPEFDMDGQTRVHGAAVDIGADEWWASIADAKKAAEASIELSGEVVTAAFPDFFYIESLNRVNGMRVEKADHGVSVGVRANVTGPVETSSNGERCIAGETVSQIGSGTVLPLAMNNASLGGGAFGLQQGIWGWHPREVGGVWTPVWSEACGLNNIGLLVRVCGKVTFAGRGWFYIDDGSKVSDGSGVLGIYVNAPGLTVPPKDATVVVTGISSCDLYLGYPVNTLLPRDQNDIAILVSPFP